MIWTPVAQSSNVLAVESEKDYEAFKRRFGRRLRGLLEERGVSQAELSRALPVGETQVSRWVRGVTYPDHRHRVAIARALKMSERELVYGD